MRETRNAVRNILVIVNAVIASGAFILKIVDPIVVRYTDEIRAADLFNFVVFTPIIMVVLTGLLYRTMQPLLRLRALGCPSPAQALELRTAAFNLPLKTFILFNLVILSGVAFVALVFDAVFYPFYPLYKRVISMGLIWSYTVCSSFAVYVYIKRRMVPILRNTSGLAPDIGRRVSIKTGVVGTIITLSAMVLLFLSAYGYSMTREALIHDKDTAAETLLRTVKQETASFSDLASLEKYIASRRAKDGVHLVDSRGDLPSLPGRPVRPPKTVEQDNSTVMKLLPLGAPFKGMSLATFYRIEQREQDTMRTMTLFFLAVGFFFLLFSGIISYSVAGETSSSIIDIADRMRRIAEDKDTLYDEFEVVSLDEVGDLTRSFNNLQRAVYRQSQQIKKLEENKHIVEKGQLREAVERAMKSLVESEMKFRTLAETTTAGIFIHRDGKLLYTNPAAEVMAGYSRDEFHALNFRDILHPDDRDRVLTLGRPHRPGSMQTADHEYRIVSKGGQIRWVNCAAGVLDFEGAPAVIATVFDITDRKRAEEEKVKLFEERIAEEKRHVLEKESLLMDLHDGIGGITTNISILSELGKNATDMSRTKETFSTISHLSREGLDEIRGFMQSLDTRELHWRTLAAELRNQGTTMMEPHGIAFNIQASLDDLEERPDSLLWINLFKIYKEALTNVMKHSKAAAVFVVLRVSSDRIVLTVQDDGVGCEQCKSGGRGLSNMRKRAVEVGGLLTVSSIEKGTRVSLEIPLPLQLPG
jgi:two-component system sensor histidine kinase UhpB